MRVLITGCSRGIGRTTAELLSERGHEVIATARRLEDLDGLGCARKLRMDVTDDEAVRAAVASADRIDAVVNNAGVGIRGPVETISPRTLRGAYEVNVFGVLRVIQAVLPQMRERRGGRIVTVSSVAGRRSMPLVGHYAATKHAVEALCEALRYELVPWRIAVSLVEPAGVKTGFSQRRIGADAPADVVAAYAEVTAAVEQHAGQAAGGAASTGEVAATILRLLEADDPPLRVTPTGQAQDMVEQRRRTGDRDWEEQLVGAIGLRTIPARAGVS